MIARRPWAPVSINIGDLRRLVSRTRRQDECDFRDVRMCACVSRRFARARARSVQSASHALIIIASACICMKNIPICQSSALALSRTDDCGYGHEMHKSITEASPKPKKNTANTAFESTTPNFRDDGPFWCVRFFMVGWAVAHVQRLRILRASRWVEAKQIRAKRATA